MKKNKLLAIIMAASFLFTACGAGADTQKEAAAPEEKTQTEAVAGTEASSEDVPAKDITLTFWAAPALVSEAEQKMPQEEWYISKVARQFEEENPGVKIELTVVPDQSAAHQTFKAAAATDSGPDIVNLWSGQSIFTMSDLILDITDMIPADDKEKMMGWETATVGFEEGGQIIGYPVSGQEVCGFIYNKDIIKEAGLDFETNYPKTLDEFMSAMEAIKNIGKLPIAAADDGWSGAYFMSFASLWVQESTSEKVASDSTGETLFAEDEAFKQSFQFMNDLYKKGYINEDYLTIPSVNELFLDGEAAMLATGNWMITTAAEVLGEENIGFCALPDINENAVVKNTAIGGPGQVLVISKNSKNPEMAVKFCSFFNNRNNQIALLKNLSKFPTRKDITLEEVGMGGSQVYDQAEKLASNYVFWADNSMIPEINAEVQSLGGMVVTGKMTVDEMADKLDQKAAELNK